MKTAISVPDHVFQAADRLAARLGMSRSELYARAVARFLDEHREERVTDALNAVYAGADSQLDAALEELQRASLPRGSW